VADGVRRLAGAGFRLGTLSNGATSVAESLLDRAGVRGPFERLLSVEEAGERKPARAAYEYGLQACGVTAERSVLVAMHPWDIDLRRAGGGADCLARPQRIVALPAVLPAVAGEAG